ncbi:MAG TPA: LytTR family DNA-binding domain-containing protein, partial [Saprospiraceae bacterium]|nr:LytTR family DNA-binding domain-containing protein [Saprospiraceae bacterium]
VVLLGENQQERLAIDAADIAFLEAQDNYVQVHYLENGAHKSKLLRATLRKMEESLAEFPAFFRCHRTYLVNFDRVEKVSGNAQGYRLHLTGFAETVPVSRSLNEEVKKRLE